MATTYYNGNWVENSQLPALKAAAANTVQSAAAPAALNYSAPYGGTPVLPDPTSTANIANQYDISQLNGGPVSQLVTNTAQSNAAGAAAAYDANLPNYQNLIGQQSSNIMSELEGALPQDVLNLLQEQGGERGIATGSPGSPNSDAAFLQSLGLTSLGLEQTGVSNLNTAIGQTPTGPAVNTQFYQVTPQQEQSNSASQALYNSAPVPAAAASVNQVASAAGRAAGAGAVQQPQPYQPQPLFSGDQTASGFPNPVASTGLDPATISALLMQNAGNYYQPSSGANSYYPEGDDYNNVYDAGSDYVS